MIDFRTVTKGPTYTGPSDSTLLYHITGFGSRKGCTLHELHKHFGQDAPYYTETLTQKITRLVNAGQLQVVNEWVYIAHPVYELAPTD